MWRTSRASGLRLGALGRLLAGRERRGDATLALTMAVQLASRSSRISWASSGEGLGRQEQEVAGGVAVASTVEGWSGLGWGQGEGAAGRQVQGGHQRSSIWAISEAAKFSARRAWNFSNSMSARRPFVRCEMSRVGMVQSRCLTRTR